MEFLLKNPTLLKQIARAFPAIDSIMFALGGQIILQKEEKNNK
jgi:hypothetical protein